MKGVCKAWNESNAHTKLIRISLHEIIPTLGFQVNTCRASFAQIELAREVQDASLTLNFPNTSSSSSRTHRYSHLLSQITLFIKACWSAIAILTVL